MCLNWRLRTLAYRFVSTGCSCTLSDLCWSFIKQAASSRLHQADASKGCHCSIFSCESVASWVAERSDMIIYIWCALHHIMYDFWMAYSLWEHWGFLCPSPVPWLARKFLPIRCLRTVFATVAVLLFDGGKRKTFRCWDINADTWGWQAFCSMDTDVLLWQAEPKYIRSYSLLSFGLRVLLPWFLNWLGTSQILIVWTSCELASLLMPTKKLESTRGCGLKAWIFSAFCYNVNDLDP